MSENKEQKAGEVPLEFAEIEADGGEEGVDGTPLLAGESVEAQAMIGFEVADDGFDGGASAFEWKEFVWYGSFAVEAVDLGRECDFGTSIAKVTCGDFRDDTGGLSC